MPSKRLTKAEKAQALDVLKKVRRFLRPSKKKPHRWMRHSWGRSKKGSFLPMSPETTECACLVGAINIVQYQKADHVDFYSANEDPAIVALASVLSGKGIISSSPRNRVVQFNDNVANGVDDVIDVIDQAIAKLTPKQKEVWTCK